MEQQDLAEERCLLLLEQGLSDGNKQHFHQAVETMKPYAYIYRDPAALIALTVSLALLGRPYMEQHGCAPLFVDCAEECMERWEKEALFRRFAGKIYGTLGAIYLAGVYPYPCDANRARAYFAQAVKTDASYKSVLRRFHRRLPRGYRFK